MCKWYMYTAYPHTFSDRDGDVAIDHWATLSSESQFHCVLSSAQVSNTDWDGETAGCMCSETWEAVTYNYK